MFWTQNLKPLAVGFALGVVNVAEESGRSAEGTSLKRLSFISMLNGPTRRSEDVFFSPFYPCGIHGAK